MTIDSIIGQIRGIRIQLEMLEAQCKTLRNSEAKPFSSLQGLLQNESPSTEEEIDAVKYRLPDLDESSS